MKQKIAMYLAGSIKKQHEKSNESFWTEEDMQTIRQHLSGFEVSFLNPAFRSDDLSDQLSVFGRDMLQVFCSDLVFVDARDRRGLGVGSEMMWAKVHQIPVLTWAPRDSHYHRSQTTILDVPVTDFIHPFVKALSDKVVGTLEEGAEWIKAMKSGSKIEIRGREYITKAMEHYKTNQLGRDKPMQELINSHEALKSRVEQLA
jgi:hypothetical protein